MTARDNPFGEIEQLFEEFTRLGDPLGGSVPVDVVDTDDEIVVYADLPGRDPTSIDVKLTESRELTIEIPREEPTADGRYVTRERTRDAVDRTIRLPAAVDDADTDAQYDQGVLEVHLRKLQGDSDGTDIPVN